MAWCRTGVATLSTAAAGNTAFQVTGLPGTPVGVIFWLGGRTEGTDSAGSASHLRGMGWATSTTQRVFVGSQSQDAVAAAATDHIYRTDACIATLTTGGAVEGLADLASFDANGFTCIIDDAFPTAYRVSWFAFGGPGVMATNGLFNEAATATTQDVTVSGFAAGADDQTVIFSSIMTGIVANTVGVDSRICFGFAGGATPGNCCWIGGSNDAATTMQTMSYCTDQQCYGGMESTITSTNSRASLTSWLTDGFRLTWAEVVGDSNREVNFLAIKGLKSLVTSVATLTDTTTDISVSSIGFRPLGALYLSHCKAESTNDTPQDHDEWSMGAADSTLAENCHGVFDEDATADSEVCTAIRHSDVYVNLSVGDAVEGAMGVTAWGANSITHRMSDADPSGAFVGVLVLGQRKSDLHLPTIRKRRDPNLRM